MRKRAVATAIVLTGAAMMLGVTSVDAAPKKGLTFTVSCPGRPPFQAVLPPGNGAFTPAFAPDGVFIVYRVTGSVTVDGTVVETFDDIKAAPVPDGAATCTFTTTFLDNGAQVVIAGVAQGVTRGPN